MTREEKMTPEEAIAEISFLKVAVNKVMEQALDMAIQALEQNESAEEWYKLFVKKLDEQEPTDENLHREREQAYMQGYEDASKRFRQEPCDDVVSRQDALNCLNGAWGDYSVLNEVYERISKLPSVTQKSGKWILLDECSNSGYYCSNCQKKLVKEGWSQTVKKIKFCPNCGCRMVEPQESEDNEE